MVPGGGRLAVLLFSPVFVFVLLIALLMEVGSYVPVADLSPISGQPQNSTVQVGELARFECQVEGTPPPSITWEKHKQPLPQDSR